MSTDSRNSATDANVELADLPARPIPAEEADQVRAGFNAIEHVTLDSATKSLDSQDKLGNTKIQGLMSPF